MSPYDPSMTACQNDTTLLKAAAKNTKLLFVSAKHHNIVAVKASITTHKRSKQIDLLSAHSVGFSTRLFGVVLPGEMSEPNMDANNFA